MTATVCCLSAFMRIMLLFGLLAQGPSSSRFPDGASDKRFDQSFFFSDKPRFDPDAYGVFRVVEGGTRSITLQARANPPQIRYSWTLRQNSADEGRVAAQGAVLTIRNARREDAGNYSVTAFNGHGDFSTNATIWLDVFYPPRVTFMSGDLIVDEGATAEFICTFEANPVDDNTVSWDLRGPFTGTSGWKDRMLMRRINQTTFALTLYDVHRSDIGQVVCAANNGIGDIVPELSAPLIVNHSPRIERTPEQEEREEARLHSRTPVAVYSRVAARKGSAVYLPCRASGYPEPEFSWSIIGSSRPATFIDHGIDEDYSQFVDLKMISRDRGEFVERPKKLNSALYNGTHAIESVLVLDNSRVEHYSSVFRCEATNKYGSDSISYLLVQPGRPDKPKYLKVAAVDDSSLGLVWKPGFDGGYNQTFQVQVEDALTGKKLLRLRHSKNIETNRTVILGLEANTRYILKVRASNRAGMSEFSKEAIVRTRDVGRAESTTDTSMPKIIVAFIACSVAMVALFTILIYLCCFKKTIRRGARQRKSKNDVVPIERYSPTKYTNTFSAEFYLDYGNPPKSISSSSSHQEEIVELVEANSNKPSLRVLSGSGPGLDGKASRSCGTCSLHGTLTRSRLDSNGTCNTTLDDNVFENGGRGATFSKPVDMCHHWNGDRNDSTSLSRSKSHYVAPGLLPATWTATTPKPTLGSRITGAGLITKQPSHPSSPPGESRRVDPLPDWMVKPSVKLTRDKDSGSSSSVGKNVGEEGMKLAPTPPLPPYPFPFSLQVSEGGCTLPRSAGGFGSKGLHTIVADDAGRMSTKPIYPFNREMSRGSEAVGRRLAAASAMSEGVSSPQIGMVPPSFHLGVKGERLEEEGLCKSTFQRRN